jgi:hypothetical protein
MTSYQVAEWLRQGIAAAQAGDAERANELLMRVVDVDEYNEQAWLWLSSVVDSEADREICLENVLAINPDNKLAKAGLVHVRTKKAQPPAPVEPEPAPPQRQSEAGEAVTPDQALDALASDWWDQPPEPTATDVVLEEPISTSIASDIEEIEISPDTATIAETPVAAEAPPPQPELWKKQSVQAHTPISWRSIAVLGLLGLLMATAAAVVVWQSGILDSGKREYATTMRPLLADYDAWWAGPQGTLVTELNRLCGSGSEGWRNSDVLYACNAHAGLDCELLAAHCEADIEAMRERIGRLAREAQRTGASLVDALDEVTPPEEIAAAHAGLRRCVQSQVDDAARIARLVRGENPGDSAAVSECESDPYAEAEVRAYVASQ